MNRSIRTLATTPSRGSDQSSAMQLSIYCRKGRTELVVVGPAISGDVQEPQAAGQSITISVHSGLNSLLETQQSARADRRCSRRDGRTKIPSPRSYRFSNSRNMIGFKLMVPWSTSGKAASQKIQTETPPTCR